MRQYIRPILHILLLAIALPLTGGAINEAFAADGKLPFSIPKDPQTLPQTALIVTEKGDFEIEFYREEAPITVRNFEYLGRKGFYKNLTFHRYVPNFVIQGGDPLGTGKGGPGYSIPPENSDLRHIRGSLGMARLPSEVNPERNSNGSQFYICLGSAPHLDGLYTVFARVINGLENVDRLRPGDRILEVKFPKN